MVWIEGFTSYDDWIRRCFVEKGGLQVLCQNCHSVKTLTENAERKNNIKEYEDNIQSV